MMIDLGSWVIEKTQLTHYYYPNTSMMPALPEAYFIAKS